MASSILDAVAETLEQVKDKVVEVYLLDDSVISVINPSKVAEASRYGYRVPILQYIGGANMKTNLNGGTIGPSGGPVYFNVTAGFFPSFLNFELSQEEIDLTSTSAAAREAVLSRVMDNVTNVFNAHENLYIMGDGTGKLTNSSSAKPAANQLTFNTATDYLKTNRLFEGQWCDVWDSTGATKRAGGPYYITSIDWDNRIVTFNGNVTGLTSGDLLSVAQADVFGPSTLVSFSSTWPGGGLTNGPGLTGDSWRHGLAYANDNTTSNYFLGKLKSSYTSLIPASYNASSNALSWEMANIVQNKRIQRRGAKILDDTMGVMHMALTQTLQAQNVHIMKWDISAKEDMAGYKDLPPKLKYGKFFNFNGIPCFPARVADMSRVDFFRRSDWGRVQSKDKPFSWWKDPGTGSMFRPGLDSSANYLTKWQFSAYSVFDYVCHDPGAGGYIYGLVPPSGY